MVARGLSQIALIMGAVMIAAPTFANDQFIYRYKNGIAPMADRNANPFLIAPVTGAEPNTVVTSEIVTPSGLDEPSDVVVNDGATVSVNGGGFASSSPINPGESFVVRQSAPSSYDDTRTVTVSIGTTDAVWSISTRAAPDTVPDAFAFISQSNAEPSTEVTSNSVTINGIDDTVTVLATGGLISIDGGAWVSSGVLSAGAELRAQVQSSSDFLTTSSVSVTVGTASPVAFEVTTRAADTTPNAFSFVAQTGVAPSTQIESSAVSITGIEGSVPVSVSGGQVSINGGPWANSGSIANNGQLRARVMSSAAFLTASSASVTVGSGSPATFGVTTRDADRTPDAFVLSPRENQEWGATIETLNPVTITGIDGTVAISADNGGQVSVANGPWAASGTIQNGQSFRVRVVSAEASGGTVSTTVTVGSLSRTFTVTSRIRYLATVYGVATNDRGNQYGYSTGTGRGSMSPNVVNGYTIRDFFNETSARKLWIQIPGNHTFAFRVIVNGVTYNMVRYDVNSGITRYRSSQDVPNNLMNGTRPVEFLFN